MKSYDKQQLNKFGRIKEMKDERGIRMGERRKGMDGKSDDQISPIPCGPVQA